jgi:hypothetical protein
MSRHFPRSRSYSLQWDATAITGLADRNPESHGTLSWLLDCFFKISPIGNSLFRKWPSLKFQRRRVCRPEPMATATATAVLRMGQATEVL